MSILMRRSGGRPSYFSDIFKYYCDNLLSMNSKEFIQACEDGKLLVWGHEGSRTVRKNDNSRLNVYLDLETGVTVIFDHMEQMTENTVMLIGPRDTSIGLIPTIDWNILEKEGKE